MRRGGVPAGKTFNATSGAGTGPTGSQINFNAQAAATGTGNLRSGIGEDAVQPTTADMINTGGPRVGTGASQGGIGAGAQGMNQPGGDGLNNRRSTTQQRKTPG